MIGRKFNLFLFSAFAVLAAYLIPNGALATGLIAIPTATPSFPQNFYLYGEKIEKITSNSALISWKTSLFSTSMVVYGKESGVNQYTSEISSLTNEHYMFIDNLEPGKKYFFQPVSRSGNFEVKGEILYVFTLPAASAPGVLSPSSPSFVTVSSCNFIGDYLKMGANNDAVEVTKLQTFLKIREGFASLEVNGVFNQATFNAVSEFQKKYKADILEPWGITEPTGYVYITTKKKINEIYCNASLPLTSGQKAEIENYKEKVKSGTVPNQEVGVNDKPKGGSKSVSEMVNELVKLENKENTEAGKEEVKEEEKDEDKKGIIAAAFGFISGSGGKFIDILPTLLVVLFVAVLLFLMYRSLKPEKTETF